MAIWPYVSSGFVQASKYSSSIGPPTNYCIHLINITFNRSTHWTNRCSLSTNLPLTVKEPAFSSTWPLRATTEGSGLLIGRLWTIPALLMPGPSRGRILAKDFLFRWSRLDKLLYHWFYESIFILQLPREVKASDIKWLTIWYEIFGISFGEVQFPNLKGKL